MTCVHPVATRYVFAAERQDGPHPYRGYRVAMWCTACGALCVQGKWVGFATPDAAELARIDSETYPVVAS